MPVVTKKNELIYPWIRNRITPIYTFVFLLLFRIFPIKKNKIIIVSYFGKGFGDNGKYIVDELLKNKKCKIIWACKNKFKDSVPNTIKTVKYYSPLYFYHLATSKIWINNARFVLGTIKRKHQFYIQVWHGDIGLKRIEADAEQALPKSYVKGAKRDSKMANIITSGSKYFTDYCRKYFWYDGEILESGCPRNDVFFKKKELERINKKVRDCLHIAKDEKILLYAPTFRKDYSLKYYDIDYKNTLECLKKKFGGKWKILVRLHPNVSAKSKQLKFWSEDVIDATGYQDSQELLIACDAAITDYSSIVFDYSLLKRPVFLFAPDYDLYNADRGFTLDYFNLPFTVSRSTKELQKTIQNFSEKKYRDRLNDYLKNEVGSKEKGEASKIIANRIIEEMKK